MIFAQTESGVHSPCLSALSTKAVRTITSTIVVLVVITVRKPTVAIGIAACQIAPIRSASLTSSTNRFRGRFGAFASSKAANGIFAIVTRSTVSTDCTLGRRGTVRNLKEQVGTSGATICDLTASRLGEQFSLDSHGSSVVPRIRSLGRDEKCSGTSDICSKKEE